MIASTNKKKLHLHHLHVFKRPDAFDILDLLLHSETHAMTTALLLLLPSAQRAVPPAPAASRSDCPALR